MELGLSLRADIDPLPMRVPGSVQLALREGGVLPDWNVQVQSRLCEWVENRHWVLETKLPAEWTAARGRKVLVCEGLDYQGVVLLNGRRVAEFCGSFHPHIFDLTPHLAKGKIG